MTLREFKLIARRALKALPDELKSVVEGLDIVVKSRPSRQLLRELEMEDDEDLFGLYEGPSLLERHVDDGPVMPSRILLFYEPLLDACETEDELIHEIQVTVLHEIGHHFGLDEDRLEELGFA